MKKVVLLIALLISGTVLNAQDHFAFGVKAGLGQSGQDVNFKYVSNTAQGNYPVPNGSTILTGNIGAYAELGIPPAKLGVYIAASLRTKGSKQEFAGDPSNNIQAISETITSTYSSFDGVAKYYFYDGGLGMVKVYGGLGLRADLKLSQTGNLIEASAKSGGGTSALASIGESGFRKSTLSGLAVAGLQVWKLGGEIEWNPDLTYSGTFSANGTSVNTRNSVVSVNLYFKIFGI